MKYTYKYMLFLTLAYLSPSCKKNWLDAKPVLSQVVPATAGDAQALLDNPAMTQLPVIGECGADNYTLSQATLGSMESLTIAQYLWAANGWLDNSSIGDWTAPYNNIFTCNVVLDFLNKKKSQIAQQEYEQLKGTALFFRAYHYFSLSQLFCKPYNNSTSSTELGIPLRLSVDVTEKAPRSSLEQVYQRIIDDLDNASLLLPDQTTYRIRPTKTACFALLARIYLSMAKYEDALKSAETALNNNSSLIDYSQLPIYTESYMISFPSDYRQNPEVILSSGLSFSSCLYSAYSDIDTTFYSSYADNDLRKKIFFREQPDDRIVWAGSYLGVDYSNFGGLAVDELFFIKAECQARTNKTDEAMATLNIISSKRYEPFSNLSASGPDEALDIILAERRKELAFRGLRWSDLRRLNQESSRTTIIKRYFNNQEYVILPGDKKYVWPIPQDEILHSDIEQNPR